jgi:hypothetical protein
VDLSVVDYGLGGAGGDRLVDVLWLGGAMKIQDLKNAFKPLVGKMLQQMEDAEQQQVIDARMEVIRGWTLFAVLGGRLASPGHPQNVTNVHLQFEDNGQLPAFLLSMRAADVHAVITVGDRTQILFKRGHAVYLDLV